MNMGTVWDCIEQALESSVEAGANAVRDAPDLLDDALAMMERGRQLLRVGLSLPVANSQDDIADDIYRAAARNGKIIPSDVLDRMHKDREVAEGQS